MAELPTEKGRWSLPALLLLVTTMFIGIAGTQVVTAGSPLSPPPQHGPGGPASPGPSEDLVATWTYNVTFSESGLPAGTSWTAYLNGSTSTGTTNESASSTTDTITFFEPNGTYAFALTNASGYGANETSGNVTVAGLPATVQLTFTHLPSSVSSLSEGEVIEVVVLLVILSAAWVAVTIALYRVPPPKTPPSKE